MKNIQRNIKLLKVFSFLEDSRFYLPITIIYFSDITGSYTLGMSLFSVIMITQAIGELPLGIFSDYLGRKFTIILGSVFAFSSVFLYALAEGYSLLCVGAILHGLARTFFSGSNQALLFESLKEVGKESSFANISGKIDSYKELALGVTALIGSVIAWYFSLGLLFGITTLPLLGCIIIGFLIVEPQIHSQKIKSNIFAHAKDSMSVFFKNHQLKNISLASSLDYAISEALFNFVPAFVATIWSNSFVGVYRGLLHVFGFIGFYYSGIIIKKFGELRSLFLFSGLENIITIFSVIFSTIFSPILLAITTLNYGIKTTAVSSILQKEFTDDKRATMGSINALLGSLFLAVLFVILGYLADIMGVVNTILLAQIFLVIPLFVYYKLFQK